MLRLRALTLAPTIIARGTRLEARTSLLLRVLTLGAYLRQVVVDRHHRYVIIERRVLWMVSSRVIPFHHVHRIEYDYRSTVTSVQRTWQGELVSADELEHFRVALILRPRTDVPDSHQHLYEERVELVSFHGEGEGQYRFALGFRGTQEELSRKYVERLRELLGVNVGQGTPQLADKAGQRWSCMQCKRPGPPARQRCYYCGGQLVITSTAQE